MTPLLLPCMGGWCEKREHCANYHQGPLTTGTPAERLCEKGQDGHSHWAVVIPLQLPATSSDEVAA